MSALPTQNIPKSSMLRIQFAFAYCKTQSTYSRHKTNRNRFSKRSGLVNCRPPRIIRMFATAVVKCISCMLNLVMEGCSPCVLSTQRRCCAVHYCIVHGFPLRSGTLNSSRCESRRVGVSELYKRVPFPSPR